MIFLLSIYTIIGLVWYFVTLTAYGIGAVFGGSKDSITNWTFRTFYDWVYPKTGINGKILVGVPIWTLLWPVSLSSSLVSVYFDKIKV
jgi:hypothetical protein